MGDVNVTQADRDAAAQLIEDYWSGANASMMKLAQSYRNGHSQGAFVQAFARHRLSAQTPEPARGVETHPCYNATLGRPAHRSYIHGGVMRCERCNTLLEPHRGTHRQKPDAKLNWPTAAETPEPATQQPRADVVEGAPEAGWAGDWRDGEIERLEGLVATYRRAQLNAEQKLCRMTASEQGWRNRCALLEKQVAALRTQAPASDGVRELLRDNRALIDELRTCVAADLEAEEFERGDSGDDGFTPVFRERLDRTDAFIARIDAALGAKP